MDGWTGWKQREPGENPPWTNNANSCILHSSWHDHKKINKCWIKRNNDIMNLKCAVIIKLHHTWRRKQHHCHLLLLVKEDVYEHVFDWTGAKIYLSIQWSRWVNCGRMLSHPISRCKWKNIKFQNTEREENNATEATFKDKMSSLRSVSGLHP